MPWLALKLEVEAGAAEALSEALLAEGALSVSLEETDKGWEHPRLVALLEQHASASGLLGRAARAAGMAAPDFTTELVPDADWVRASQAQFEPFAIGEALWIGPGWVPPAPGARAVVRLDPGLAFGTGSHPSTRLILRELVEAVRGGESVLDYGCGSGILAIAAAKLGAREVDAVDIDPQAVETTRENAALNGVGVHAAAAEALAPRRYDIVVSNILAQPLILLAPLLAAHVAPGGRVALSGILASQAAEVSEAYAPYLAMEPPRLEDGWALVRGRRK